MSQLQKLLQTYFGAMRHWMSRRQTCDGWTESGSWLQDNGTTLVRTEGPCPQAAREDFFYGTCTVDKSKKNYCFKPLTQMLDYLFTAVTILSPTCQSGFQTSIETQTKSQLVHLASGVRSEPPSSSSNTKRAPPSHNMTSYVFQRTVLFLSFSFNPSPTTCCLKLKIIRPVTVPTKTEQISSLWVSQRWQYSFFISTVVIMQVVTIAIMIVHYNCVGAQIYQSIQILLWNRNCWNWAPPENMDSEHANCCKILASSFLEKSPKQRTVVLAPIGSHMIQQRWQSNHKN